MLPSLYAITNDIQVLMSSLEDGELDGDLGERLDGLSMAFEEKVENVLLYRAGQIAAANGIQAEIERLTKLQVGYVGRSERLKDYVYQSMKRLGIDKVSGKLIKCWVQKNGRPSIKLVGDEIPEFYRRTKVEFDSQLAYGVWKDGGPLPPEIVVEQGSHLQVR